MNTKVNLYEKNPRKIHVKSTRESNVKPRETQKNFKQAITNVDVTPESYKDILNNIKGDANSGFEFSEVVKVSLAYLINFCFSGLEDHEYNLKTFKGILDKANINFQLGYKPNLLEPYNGNAKVKETELFIYAYSIVQFDYYFKSIDLKSTDFYKYTQHYFTTGQKLDITSYNGDSEYLLLEYDKMDKQGNHRAKYHIKKAFVGSLFILLNDLELPTIHFKNSISDCREYNAMVKTPREFRKYFPFKLLEFDIKSAFPNFIDTIIDTDLGANVYDYISTEYNVTRNEAKILFNKWLNSTKYKTASQFDTFFRPIYKDKTPDLVSLLIDADKPFWKLMFYWEYIAIETFVQKNNLTKYTRLHDAIFLIDNEYNQTIKEVNFAYATFGAKSFYSKPTIEVATNKKVAIKYAPAIPYELRGNLLIEVNHNKNIYSKRIGSFRIYREPFYYLNANFNIASNGVIKKGEFEFLDKQHFLDKLQNMVNVLAYCNEIDIRGLKFYLKGILNHILQNGVLTFDVNDLIDYLIIGVESPTYDFKNSIYISQKNISIFEYQSEYYKSLKMFDLICYSESIFKVVETSYKTKSKIFIDANDLAIQKSKGNDVIFDLIDSFNAANGFTDVRTASKIKEINNELHEVCHPIENNLYSVAKNVHNPYEIKDFDFLDKKPYHHQTKKKFIKWFNHKQDRKAIQEVYFTLKEIISNNIDFEVTKVNGRNAITEKLQKEQKTNKLFAEAWSQLKEDLPTQEEHLEKLKDSILNIEETEAIQQGDEFYRSWKLFNKEKYQPREYKITHHNEQNNTDRQILFEFKKGA
jgi:hypothetical protein